MQGITDLNLFADNQFDLVICSEVLEHIKEYGKEDQAVNELKRITRPSGVIVIGTPNKKLLPDHGFSFEEMDPLMKKPAGLHRVGSLNVNTALLHNTHSWAIVSIKDESAR